MTKILMVCLGNICRSPLAEGILEAKVDPKHVIVDSAGTAGYHIGEPPDERSVQVAKKYGIDISGQRCRQFVIDDFSRFDRIYVMDHSNYQALVSQATTAYEKNKIKLLLEETDLGVVEVPDPYYGGRDGFEKVYALINSACEAIARKISTDG